MQHADVVIIGGGPAGSILGCYLSQAGISNVILEKKRHPRAHVGESLVPSTTRVFREIDFLATMERENFVRKYGAAWHSFRPARQFSLCFQEFPLPGVNQDYTYHVDRSRFDRLLFQHARSRGSQVRENTHVRQVNFDGERATGVSLVENGREQSLDARCVIDASGRATLLGSQLRWKRKDPLFDQFAVHAWFEGVQRGRDETADFIHVYFLPVKRGWVWQIPITDTITSMGVVADRSVFRASRGRVQAWFSEMIPSNPHLQRAMAGARPVTAFRSDGNYCYSMERFAGEGFLLVGDAARFVDPIFSSGVSVAAESARLAAQAIIEALANGQVTAQAFLPYEERLRAGVDVWYEFIVLYYRLMHLFTYFVNDPESRQQILSLVQGDVYDRGQVPVLDRMREIIETVEETPGHVWRPYLRDVAPVRVASAEPL